MAVIKAKVHLPHNDKMTVLLDYPLFLFSKGTQVHMYHMILLGEHHHCISPLFANQFIFSTN
jgi:hypothetical protein